MSLLQIMAITSALRVRGEDDVADPHNSRALRASLRRGRHAREREWANGVGDEVYVGDRSVGAMYVDVEADGVTQRLWRDGFARRLSPFVEITVHDQLRMTGEPLVCIGVRLRPKAAPALPAPREFAACCRDALDRRERYCRSGHRVAPR